MPRASRPLLVWLPLFMESATARAALSGIRRAARERGGVVLRLVEPRRIDRVPPEVDGILGRTNFAALPAFADSRPAVALHATAVVPPHRRVHTAAEPAAAVALDHLVGKSPRHLAVYLAAGVTGAGRERAACFERLAAARGLRVARFEPNTPAESIGDAPLVSALARWLTRQPRPLGLMAVDDWHGLRAVDACREAGLGVPEDVAVLGHGDDEAVCRFSDPPLSSVAPDQDRVGYAGMRLLLRLLDGGPELAEPLRIPPLGVTARGSTEPCHGGDPLVVAALAYIRDHLGEGISGGDVVAHVPASASTLQRRFQEHLGRSVREVVQGTRIERVALRLLADDAPLAVIAAETGFPHVSQLCREFKKVHRLTPTQYRLAHRGSPAADSR